MLDVLHICILRISQNGTLKWSMWHSNFYVKRIWKCFGIYIYLQPSPHMFVNTLYIYLLWLPFWFFGLSHLLFLVSLDIDAFFCLFRTSIWNIQWRWSLYVRILCGLFSCDSSPYVRSAGHVFAYLYTLDDDSECPMDYETSLLPKVFSLQPSSRIFVNTHYIYLHLNPYKLWVYSTYTYNQAHIC